MVFAENGVILKKYNIVSLFIKQGGDTCEFVSHSINPRVLNTDKGGAIRVRLIFLPS